MGPPRCHLAVLLPLQVKDPANRSALASSASQQPGMFGDVWRQIKDYTEVADVNDEVGPQAGLGQLGSVMHGCWRTEWGCTSLC
jgi:hypothetical protein